MVKVDPMCHRKKGREWPILWTGQKIKEQRLPSIHFKDRRDGGCDKILPVRWKANSDRWMRSRSLWSVLQIWLRCPNHLWSPRRDWRSKTTPGHDPHFWIKRGWGKMRHGGKKNQISFIWASAGAMPHISVQYPTPHFLWNWNGKKISSRFQGCYENGLLCRVRPGLCPATARRGQLPGIALNH